MWGTISSLIFPGGRTLKLVKSGVNITNSTNAIGVAKNITLTVIDCCAPPVVKLPVRCLVLGGTLLLPTNPITAGFTIEMIRDIYEECIAL